MKYNKKDWKKFVEHWLSDHVDNLKTKEEKYFFLLGYHFANNLAIEMEETFELFDFELIDDIHTEKRDELVKEDKEAWTKIEDTWKKVEEKFRGVEYSG